MKKIPYVATPNRTKEIIKKHGFSFKKSLGQNFLIDQNIINKILEAAQLNFFKGVFEVGPGIGALTEQMAQVCKTVASVEIDQRLIPILYEVLSVFSNVHVHHGDILKLDLQQFFSQHFSTEDKVSVVANLPYYATTAIIMKILEKKLPIDLIVVMTQKEVADRMMASPGSKSYGSLSIAVQYYSVVENVCSVPNTVFIPQPNVASQVIKLKIREYPLIVVPNESHFFTLIRNCFSQRRKTIFNNLKNVYYTKQTQPQLVNILKKINIDPLSRAETLSPEQFAHLSIALWDAGMR